MRAAALALLVSVAMVGGCATVVSVTRVTPENELKVCGTRYYLPQPFILASPQSDGSLQVSVEYLPNKNEQYAVCSWSVFATHELSMKLNQGMLTEINWVADSSAVAAESIKTAGEIEKTVLDTKIEAAKAQKTQTEKAATDLATQVATAQVELAQAEAEYAVVTHDPDASAEDKRKARVARDKARAKRDALAAACRRMRCMGGGTVSGGNVPGANRVQPSDGEQTVSYVPPSFDVAGPVMFRVAPVEGDSVKLEPWTYPGEGNQGVYKVYNVVAPGSGSAGPAAPAKLTVTPTDLGTIDIGPQPKDVSLSFSEHIGDHIGYTFYDLSAQQPVPDANRPAVKRKTSKEVVVTFTNATSPGKYEMRLTLFAETDPGKSVGALSVPVRVR